MVGILPYRDEGYHVEMVLLDWTRMGKNFCLAGAVAESGRFRIVRPLPVKVRDCPTANVGWTPYLLGQHTRWEVFSLVGPEPATTEAPHVEDVWVRSLKPQRRLAAPELRRAILENTRAEAGQDLFGMPLKSTRTAAYLLPGTGARSLSTVALASSAISLAASWRDGAGAPDYRVTLPVPGLGPRTLPVKDHHLLRRAEASGSSTEQLVAELNRMIRDMGAWVGVRLGLSRGFLHEGGLGLPRCWLMADGFFSMTDPQP
jgi:hypothetical protein